MQRPGFLAGFEGMKPRNGFSGLKPYNGLGFFGKAWAIPAPGAPPIPGGGKLLPNAIDTKTGKFYTQDPRCAEEGQKMTKIDVPCTDPDCDPGERDIYEECEDDPNYKELPPPPADGFTDCNEWKAAGYPGADCNQQTCPSCFAPKQPKQQQQQQLEPTPDNSAEQARLQAELMSLQQQQAAVSQMPSNVPMISQTYTGGSMPIMSSRPAMSQEEKREAQLEQLVAEHQTQQAVARAYAPPAAPVVRAPAPVVASDDDDEPAKSSGGGFFSWLKTTLFGTAGGSGFGATDKPTWIKYLIPALVIYGLYRWSKS